MYTVLLCTEWDSPVAKFLSYSYFSLIALEHFDLNISCDPLYSISPLGWPHSVKCFLQLFFRVARQVSCSPQGSQPTALSAKEKSFTTK